MRENVVTRFVPGIPGPVAVSVATIAQLESAFVASFVVGTLAFVSAPTGGIAPGFFEYAPSSTATPDANNVVESSGSGNWLRVPSLLVPNTVSVNSATVPTPNANDTVILFDSSSYTAAALEYELWSAENLPYVGQSVLVVWWKWTSGSDPPPIVSNGSNQTIMTPLYMQESQSSGALSSSIVLQQGLPVRLIWTGSVYTCNVG